MSRAVFRNSRVTDNNNFHGWNTVNSYSTEFSRCATSIPEEKGQVLEWLSPWASRERHEAVRKERVDGVGEWLLRGAKFSRWHTWQTVKPVLLCYGDPGVGKTYISSLVIDTLSEGTCEEGVATAYIYCDFTAGNVQSASNLLGSVLRQVVEAMAETPDDVLLEFQHAEKQGDGCRLQPSEILNILIRSLSSFQRSFICIDALDEVPQKEWPELWQSLERLILESPTTRLFLTGRPHIRVGVRKHFPGTAEMLQIRPREDDIGLYLTMRFDQDPEPDAMDGGLQADILRVVSERISRRFLLVCLNMDTVLAQATVRRRRKALYRITKSSCLQNAYDTVIDRIRQQGGNKARLGLEALMWVSRSERPLKAQELCHALGVELRAEDFDVDNVPTIRTVLGCTLGLVTVGEKDSVVRLLHLTLQEYLGEHPTLFETAHSMMAEVCLTYLNCRFVNALPSNPDKALVIAPFLEYATSFWGIHTSMQVTKPAELLVLQLLDGYEDHVSAAVFWQTTTCEGNPLKYIDESFPEEIKGISGLHCIAYWGIEEIAITMLDTERWDINAQDSAGGTPLSWALQYGKGRMVELFSEQGDIKPDKVIRSGRTVLSLAAELGDESVVELLLERGDVNPDSEDEHGRTPLSYAARSGHEGVVKLLLENGNVDPNSWDNGFRTPLSYAAEYEREGVVKILLRRGDLDPNSADEGGRTPLSYAAESVREGVVKLLLKHGDLHPDSADEGGRTPLSYAAEFGREGGAKLLLNCGDVNPDSVDEDGRTPLLYAAKSGHEDVVKLLLDRGDVDLDSRDEYGRTPLSYAAKSRLDGVVKLLLEHGALNADMADDGCGTPLSIASERGDECGANMIQDWTGVNPNLFDHSSRTPLSFGTEWGYEGGPSTPLGHEYSNSNSADYYSQISLERGDVNADTADHDCGIPLSIASERGDESKVDLLPDRLGANPNSQDNNSRTPLPFAAERGYEGGPNLPLGHEHIDRDSLENDGQAPLPFTARRGYQRVLNFVTKLWKPRS